MKVFVYELINYAPDRSIIAKGFEIFRTIEGAMNFANEMVNDAIELQKERGFDPNIQMDTLNMTDWRKNKASLKAAICAFTTSEGIQWLYRVREYNLL